MQPAATPLDVEKMIDALSLLVARLRPLTPHQAAHRLDDLAWDAADALCSRVGDYLQDAPPRRATELVAAQRELQHELYRLRVMRVLDSESDRMVSRAIPAVTFSGAETCVEPSETVSHLPTCDACWDGSHRVASPSCWGGAEA